MAGPLPAVRYCTDTPSAVAVRTAIGVLASGVCCARGATGCATSARTNANTQTQCRLAMRSLLNREHCRYARFDAVFSIAPGLYVACERASIHEVMSVITVSLPR